MLNIHTNRSNKAEFDPYGLYTFSPKIQFATSFDFKATG